jgi:rhodanese-related sulfurtransferase
MRQLTVRSVTGTLVIRGQRSPLKAPCRSIVFPSHERLSIMASPTEMTVQKLMRLVGTPAAPALIDVRVLDDYLQDPRLLPASQRRSHKTVADWTDTFSGQTVVVVCHHGAKLSQGTAAWLRHAGVDAVSLEGGFEGWKAEGLPLIPVAKLPVHDFTGQSIWVTRARPKVDRIACPWLIRRFVDPRAVFLFVNPSEVAAVAERFGGVAFDIENTFWSHRGELCTFDVMLEEFGLQTEPLLHLGRIVRGADTARPDLAPEAAGLLAVSLGLSRLYADDVAQLDAAMVVYDALYRWCRDATDETHNWPTNKVKP